MGTARGSRAVVAVSADFRPHDFEALNGGGRSEGAKCSAGRRARQAGGLRSLSQQHGSVGLAFTRTLWSRAGWARRRGQPFGGWGCQYTALAGWGQGRLAGLNTLTREAPEPKRKPSLRKSKT